MDNGKCKLSEKDIVILNDKIIGEGAFGKVFLAKIKKTGEILAVKIVYQDKRYKNRELSIMKEFSHPNIVKLVSFYYTQRYKKIMNKTNEETYLNIIMDYIPQTLSNILYKNTKMNKILPMILIKLYAFQMLKSIGYMHSIGICHRDIKPDNILINENDYTLKICDFGCAKRLIKGEPNISYICSRYYRPPELVLECTDYTTQVDVWSIGCCIAELVTNKPIFPGTSKEEQFIEFIKLLGTPTEQQILELNPKINLNNIKNKFPEYEQIEWKDYFADKTDNMLFIDLVNKLLVYEPRVRLRPYQAMCHPFFDELRDPKLILPNGKKIPSHLFEFKQCEMDFDKDSILFLTLMK